VAAVSGSGCSTAGGALGSGSSAARAAALEWRRLRLDLAPDAPAEKAGDDQHANENAPLHLAGHDHLRR
jgi:hypothetical protein